MNAQIKNQFRVVLATGVSALVLAPIAAAGVTDGRSPDTKDAAATARMVFATTADLRSPDTRDAAVAAHSEPATPVDLRSPDTRDAALLAHSPGPTVVVASGSQGFDWTDAGIGAAGGFAIALIVAGMLVLVRLGSRRKLAL